MVRIRARVSGEVQGVGFRYAMHAAARRCVVTGWVRNRDDGSVELEAQGEREAVEQFLDAVRQGSRFSQVENVETRPMEPIPESGFSITG